MFTGIVTACGHIERLEPTADGRRLVVDPGPWTVVPGAGDSIAVAGVCLTVVEPGPPVHFDVVAQTLRLTTLGERARGDRINLESAVTPTTVLGGHIVQGHVDGVGRVVEARGTDDADEEWRVRIEPPPELLSTIVLRGSITVDGVALTVAGLDERTFEVALIPTTREVTTMGALAVGSRVNLETDYIVKAVARWLEVQRPAPSDGA